MIWQGKIPMIKVWFGFQVWLLEGCVPKYNWAATELGSPIPIVTRYQLCWFTPQRACVRSGVAECGRIIQTWCRTPFVSIPLILTIILMLKLRSPWIRPSRLWLGLQVLEPSYAPRNAWQIPMTRGLSSTEVRGAVLFPPPGRPIRKRTRGCPLSASSGTGEKAWNQQPSFSWWILGDLPTLKMSQELVRPCSWWVPLSHLQISDSCIQPSIHAISLSVRKNTATSAWFL